MQNSDKDFFISYSSPDQSWAEWIAWVLEEHGYSVVIQAWDFRTGGNWVLDMQQAVSRTKRTIMILSEAYLNSAYAKSEWAAAFVQDPDSSCRKLLPIKVRPCQPTGLLATIQHEDLTIALSEIEAQNRLLSAVRDSRIKPETRPLFPGPLPDNERVVPNKVRFPGFYTSLAAAGAAFLSLSSLPDWEHNDYSTKHHEGGQENTLEDVFLQIANKYGFQSLLSKTNFDEKLEETLEKIIDRYDLNSFSGDHTIQFDQHETVTISQESVQSIDLDDADDLDDVDDDSWGGVFM